MDCVVEREKSGEGRGGAGAIEERRREYGSNLVRLKTSSELKKILLTLSLSADSRNYTGVR